MEEASIRRPAYCSVRSFQEFLKRIQSVTVPRTVDRAYLRQLRVAENNEWALLSALKFLRIVDERGLPTPAFRRLQTTEWRTALRSLVHEAYAELIEIGGEGMSQEALRSFFALTASGSQAQNAARFFRKAVDLTASAGAAEPSQPQHLRLVPAGEQAAQSEEVVRERVVAAPPRGSEEHIDRVLRMKEAALSLIPSNRDSWPPADYQRVLSTVLEILKAIEPAT
jgi:Family of unknown function (DUF5343)